MGSRGSVVTRKEHRMKQPWEWEEEDLEELIANRVQESVSLDYKRCAALDKRNPKSRGDLSKDVSAFANSSGGTLIYGVIEQNNLPIALDSGIDPAIITREWVEQIIQSSIDRRVEGTRIKQIELKKSSPGKVAYVVHVPESNRAPHMADDYIFYKRYNFQSVPMKEYEVREAIHKNEIPDLKLLLSIESTKLPYFAPDQEYSDAIKLQVIIRNESETPATHAHIRLYFDKVLDNYAVGAGFVFAGMEDIRDEAGNEVRVRCCIMNWATPATAPIWNTLDFILGSKPIELFVPRGEGKYHISWKIHAPRMSPKLGFYSLTVDERCVQLIRLA